MSYVANVKMTFKIIMQVNYDLFRVLMAVIFGAFAVGQTSSFAPDYAQAKISANRLFKLLDRVPEIDSSSTEGKQPVSFEFIQYFVD